MRLPCSVICLLVAALSPLARGQCTPQRFAVPINFPLPSQSFSYTFEKGEAAPWNIDVTVLSQIGNNTLSITPESGCVLPCHVASIKVTNKTANWVAIAIKKNGADDRFLSVGSFQTLQENLQDPGHGDVLLTDLDVLGNVGPITATSLPGAIDNYRIGGNLTGNITLLKRKTSPGFDQLVSMQVTGDMLGGIGTAPNHPLP